MSSEIISQARALLETSQPDQALSLLHPHLNSNLDSIPFLTIFGETLLENNQLEQAYQVLYKACELDPQAESGAEKFLYLGQIIGGMDGVESIDIGLKKLMSQLEKTNNGDGVDDEILKLYDGDVDKLRHWIVGKLNSGIFAQIEIWMTDLCMSPEAEQKCNELIEYSLSLDPGNAEAYSLLSSIRISQQRPAEAIDALTKSWELFSRKKMELENSANKLIENKEDAFDVGMEYVELIQPLLTLSRFAVELEMYDVAMVIASSVQDINESVLDSYYIEALANLFKAKQLLSNHHSSGGEIKEDYRDIDVGVLKKSDNPDIQTILKEARSSLTSGYKIINSDAVEDCDPGLVDQVNELLQALGGPIMSELLPKRTADEEEEGWEDEIQSEDEDEQ
ncbi:uncharacterized protein J8A68_005802 [[Candida] subhashii]|uniref:Assembly chaperone of RPL4 n=1 Tax=[Candida] subhashii TaxID=561895 RepID=A0A8J5QLF3_9ASCO|nr:uncharacterized protein J8A68_005802 [[Candida] subhashii]KAG7660685.1 hypothetical protein J8A68_005802 [[Candida] subhashii]